MFGTMIKEIPHAGRSRGDTKEEAYEEETEHVIFTLKVGCATL